MPLIDENRRLDGIAGANNEWQSAFDGISEWISIHDNNFRIVRANKALAEALHTTPEALVGEYCYDVICSSHQACSGVRKSWYSRQACTKSRGYFYHGGQGHAPWPPKGQLPCWTTSS